MAGGAVNANVWNNPRRVETNLPDSSVGELIVFRKGVGGPLIVPIPGANGRIPKKVEITLLLEATPDFIVKAETDTEMAQLVDIVFSFTSQSSAVTPKYARNDVNPLTTNPGSITYGNTGAAPRADLLIHGVGDVQIYHCFF